MRPSSQFAQCTVVSVDYRLAAHRHPAALHDILIALDWAQARAAEGWAAAPCRRRENAGGTLAACAALPARLGPSSSRTGC
ncbi:alpha/beta hydrolase fold domain-containing protein [Streptomyces sp. NPDC046324]|uniref:alpha/beta hydrolase fold domain-containing protein n=1 Tax=unclassified Streptomyces TaxID=2593676 RepID=UPI0033FC85DC